MSDGLPLFDWKPPPLVLATPNMPCCMGGVTVSPVVTSVTE